MGGGGATLHYHASYLETNTSTKDVGTSSAHCNTPDACTTTIHTCVGSTTCLSLPGFKATNVS